MENEHKPSRWPLYLALALYLVFTGLLIWKVRLGAAPDEFAHLNYVEHIATTGKLPVFKGQAPPAPGYEFHQPPLYYAVTALFWAVLPAGVENYAARVVSLLCGLATIVLVWGAARRVFPQRHEIAALAALFVALSPLHQGVGAVAGNDALAGLIGAALFYVGSQALINGPTKREIWQIGVLVGLGLLTKTTILVVSFAALGALYLAAKRHSQADAEKPSSLKSVLTATLIGLVVAAPFLLRNQALYGDPLALSAFSSAATAGTPGFPLFSQAGMDFLTYARGMLWMILLTTWGFYGGSDTASRLTSPLGSPYLPDTYLLLPLAIFALAPLVALIGWKRQDEEAGARMKQVGLFWGVGVVLVVLAWMQFAYGHFSGGQARYLHPALLPTVIFLVAGWCGAFGRGRALWLVSGAFGLVMIALTLLNLLHWKTLV